MATGSDFRQGSAACDDLEQAVLAVLETYANVHRGSGHHSIVTTHLYETARTVVLDHLGLRADRYAVVFGTPRSADALAARLEAGRFVSVSSADVGLPLGVRAVAIERGAWPHGVPPVTGGGTARLVGPEWVMWAKEPDRFEAGTPAIVNVIAFAKALQLRRRAGQQGFGLGSGPRPTPADIIFRDDLDQLTGRALLDALRQRQIGRGVHVPTADGPRPFINLDNAASTPTFEPVWAAVRESWRLPADERPAVIEAVRSAVLDVLGAPASGYDVVFTANTTDAINLVAEDLARDAATGAAPVVINTLLEHNSNELPWRTVPGVSLRRLSMDAEGFVDVRQLEAWLRQAGQRRTDGRAPVTLVAVSGASNVLGVCNDLREIACVVHTHGARLLVDGAQLLAHRPIEMAADGIDYLVCSAHKAYAPFGTGALVARSGLLGFSGAEMERIRRAGEENVGGIAAMGKALVLLQRIGFDLIHEEERVLTARALTGMATIPGLKVLGMTDPASPAFARKGGVIPFDVKGRMAHGVARALAARGGIGVRSGCHCAHLTVKRLARVPGWAEQIQRLILMVFRRFELPGVVRVSLGLENTADDVDTLLRVLADVAVRPRLTAAEQHVPRRLDDACAAAARRVYAMG